MAQARQFETETILITGATDGIGLALARRLAGAGARLVLIGRRPLVELTDELFSPERYCQTDLAGSDCSRQVVEWLERQGIERLDCVIHNAGVGYVGLLSQQPLRSVTELLRVNVYAPIALTHALFERVAAAKGRFVYISSVAASVPVADYAVYGASKAGLEAFVRNFQCELAAAAMPVEATVVQIGATRTGMHAKSGATRERMNWERFPAADAMAAKVLEQISGGADSRDAKVRTAGSHLHAKLGSLPRRKTIGAGNRGLVWFGRMLPGLAYGIARRTAKAEMLEPATLSVEPEEPRHCVITGAAAGIGRALAIRYGKAGYTITGVDIDRDAAMRTQAELINQGIAARFVVADLARPEHLAAIEERLAERPTIDVLIHCAGISAVGYFHQQEWELQARVLDVNLLAPVHLTQRILARKRMRRGGSLVYLASLAHFTGYPGAAVYGASKAGVSALGQSLGVALQQADINVLTVYPGPVRTEHARRYSPENSPEHRRMEPETVANAIFAAERKRRASLTPGVAAKLSAWAGTWMPRVTEWVMRRTILDKLEK